MQRRPANPHAGRKPSPAANSRARTAHRSRLGSRFRIRFARAPEDHVTATESYGPLSRHLFRDALRHRWPIVVLCAALFAGAAAGLVTTGSQSFTATSRVLVNPLSGNPF